MIIKTTTKLIALLSLIMLFTSAKAQYPYKGDKKEMCDYLMQKSAYVFEGEVISTKNFTLNNGSTYSSTLIDVKDVIKGSVTKGTIEIIKFVSTIDKNGQSVTIQSTSTERNPSPPKGLSLFFANDDIDAPNKSGVTKANLMPIKLIEAVSFINHQELRSPLYHNFISRKELNNYLNTTYNLNMDEKLLEKKTLISKKANKINQLSSTNNCTDLFISEYLDGAGSNNAVEIFNPTASPISLSNYKLLIYHSASYTATTIALTGTISAFGTHVVVQQGASSSITAHANQTTNNLNFSGDVCTVLNKGNIHIDKIGEIGVANAAGNWTLTPAGGTNNADIRRAYIITKGDTAWSSCKTQWGYFSEDSISNLGKHRNSCSYTPTNDPDFTLTFANATANYVDSTFSFEIWGESTGEDTYLDEMYNIFITYNPLVFGYSISAAGTVTLTADPAFAPPTYGDVNYYSGDVGYSSNADTLGIQLATDTSDHTPNRGLLQDGVPARLMTIKMKYLLCSNYPNISFVTDPTITFGAYTSSATVLGSYLDTNYTHILFPSPNLTYPQLPCAIQITDFGNNNPANANGNAPIITGHGFGATQGTGSISFKNADDGGATYAPPLDPTDYSGNWSDGSITFYLPDFTDSAETNNYLGGGNFVVINSLGQMATSGIDSYYNLPFTIPYNVFEDWGAGLGSNHKFEINRRNDNGLGGYTIRFDSITFPKGSIQRAIYYKAMRDWTCFTGMNWIIGKDTFYTPIANVADGVNYVFFSSNTSIVPSSELASTYLARVHCSDAAILTSVHMGFNSLAHFVYDSTLTVPITSTQADFYGVCLHELGHFVGLAHHTDPTNLMYFQANNGPIAAANRQRLVAGTSVIDGGLWSVSQGASNSNCTGAGGIPKMMSVNNSCSAPSGINQLSKNNFFFKLYPNPSDGSNINVEFQAPTNTNVQLVVYDMMGRAVYTNNLNDRNEINSAYSLDVLGLASGVYMVNLIIDNIKVCQKIIKN